jgi:hypothetical protein
MPVMVAILDTGAIYENGNCWTVTPPHIPLFLLAFILLWPRYSPAESQSKNYAMIGARIHQQGKIWCLSLVLPCRPHKLNLVPVTHRPAMKTVKAITLEAQMAARAPAQCELETIWRSDGLRVKTGTEADKVSFVLASTLDTANGG